MTNGLLQKSHNSSDTTESESLTATMFNLKSLNEGHPNQTRGHVVLIDNQSHYSFDSYINLLVRNTDRARFIFEDGSPSEGPQIRRAQSVDNTVHEAHYSYGSRLVKAQSLDTRLENTGQHGPQRQNPISTSPMTFYSNPGQNSNLWCDESTSNSRGSTRKSLGMEIGRLGRNVRQKLLCSCLDNEGNPTFLKGYTCCIVYTMLILLMIISLLIQMGVGKLALHSFLNSHEDFKLEL